MKAIGQGRTVGLAASWEAAARLVHEGRWSRGVVGDAHPAEGRNLLNVRVRSGATLQPLCHARSVALLLLRHTASQVADAQRGLGAADAWQLAP